MNFVSIALGAGLSLFLAAALLWIPVPGFKKIRLVLLQSLRGPVSQDYDRNKTIHSLGVLGLTFLILIHLLQSGLFQEVPPLSKVGYLLLFSTGFILFVLSKTSLFRSEAQVVSVSIRAGIVLLTLKAENRSSFKNGQFAFLQLNGEKRKHRQHPFSYLTGETSLGGKEHIIQFAARIVGSFTNELSSLKPGDQVFLRNGFGNFRPENESKICLIGSGIGIVPLISLMEQFHESGDTRNVEVFFSVNSREEIPRLAALQTLSAEMENMNLHLLVYEEDQRLYSYDYFNERLAAPGDYSYYLCSSPGVRSAVLAVLKKMGIRRNHIHYESFSFA
jgi:predicted ferric reductase